MDVFKNNGLKMAIWTVHELNQTTQTQLQLIQVLDRAVLNSSFNLALHENDYQNTLKELAMVTLQYRAKAKEIIQALKRRAAEDGEEELDCDLASEIQQFDESNSILKELAYSSKSGAQSEYKQRQISEVNEIVSKYCEAFPGVTRPNDEDILNGSFTSKGSLFNSQAPSVFDCHHSLKELQSELRCTSKKLVRAEKELAELRSNGVQLIRGRNEDPREEKSFETDCLGKALARQQSLPKDKLHRVETNMEVYLRESMLKDQDWAGIVESYKSFEYVDKQGVSKSMAAIVKCKSEISENTIRSSQLFSGSQLEGKFTLDFKYSN